MAEWITLLVTSSLVSKAASAAKVGVTSLPRNAASERRADRGAAGSAGTEMDDFGMRHPALVLAP